MNELTFRGKDRLRVSWPHFVVVCAVVVASGVLAYHRLGGVTFSWVTGGMLAFAGLTILLTLRSWTKVGAAGITIYWGIGRRRTYSWQEIRWIDVREITGGAGSSLAVRITLVDGRRRSLPALQQSSVYVQPTFYADFQRVVNWWKASTEPAARFQPPKGVRDRVTPGVAGLVLGVLTIVIIGLVTYSRG